MKKILSLAFALLLITSILSKEKILSKAKTDKSGESSNFQGGRQSDAVAWGYAHNDGYVLASNAGFINPQIMSKIPRTLNTPYPGVMAQASEVRSGGKFYYDGTSNLSALHINCNVLSTNPPACIHNSNCGWCGSNNSCVSGNSAGPLGHCLRNTFLYTSPSSDWNPLKAGTINILGQNKSGGNSFILTPEPNLKAISVK